MGGQFQGHTAHHQLTTLNHKPHTSKHKDQHIKQTSTSFILHTINQTYVHLNGVHITMTHTLSNTQSYKPFTTTNHQHHTASYTMSPIPFIRSMDMGAMPDNASVIIASDRLWDMIDHCKAVQIV
ncbi:uncharacterized protein ACA1_386050 [Acanthamoeba castellanii str. Neff]|uniref:PPM-type phosphatase domain-containing protein n=1 Tax=Acanthamoeba castellanii (strain ATCC 30010 / Neff) TaxID=1257118 RepID=L8H9A1_ACACF|nr:uncharacterized protein ACA1_386050 [Acanthamoeba castellanii str. Neff]ELR21817.1 hypothetical protein ACA1_386050 [Acanthamoeba castellanii str. Neff]